MKKLLTVLLLCVATSVFAQTKQKISFEASAAISKYTQQYAIDVGDVPGHQIRIFEMVRDYGSNGPMIEGVRLKTTASKFMTDFIELNGSGVGYQTMEMENGDKVFSRSGYTAQSSGDGSAHDMQVYVITGGTGKFLGIRGIVRSATSANPKAGTVSSKIDLEYWMMK